ncbi:endonuclease III domain-containing protein [Companilactobacillus sp. DQM5]|uniref:endonuclease III domain-containing protein n=1 Tax=Companilactobacillus sp. DQM5 TaxID=3463359 RepID=UPI004058D6C5
MKYDYYFLYNFLYKKFGPQYWWPADSEWEMMIGAILVQNTNWKNVEKSLSNLKRKTNLEPQVILTLSQGELIKLIKPSGFYINKSKSIFSLLRFFKQYNWNIRLINEKYISTNELRKALLNIHGIGDETADVILLYIFNRRVFVADKYSRVLISELEGIDYKKLTYQKVKSMMESELNNMNTIQLQEFHALIDEHSSDFLNSILKK